MTVIEKIHQGNRVIEIVWGGGGREGEREEGGGMGEVVAGGGVSTMAVAVVAAETE